MRHEWFLVRHQNGKFVDKSPYAMSKSAADNLLELARMTDKNFTYSVKHRKDV